MLNGTFLQTSKEKNPVIHLEIVYTKPEGNLNDFRNNGT